jgi:G3E family GTPase
MTGSTPSHSKPIGHLLPPDVFRAKGVLWIEGSNKRYLFHMVGQRFTLDETPLAGLAGNRLVLIGRNLDSARLRDQLEACAAE